MKKSVGIAVLVIGILLAAFGLYQDNSSKTVAKLGKLELTAKTKDSSTNPLLIGGGVIALIGLVVVIVAKK
jgi:hypothetical protein